MVKKKTNPLNKRFLRELKSEAGKYIVLFVFIAGVIALVSGFLVASGSMSQAYDESFEKYNIEDGNFEVKREASSGLLDALQKDGTKIYPNFYKEEQTKNVESTLRIFKKRTEIDLECLMEGSFPEDENEIAIDRMYAVNNKISVGDVMELGDVSYTICGLVALSDYSALFSSTSDMMFDAVRFGVAIVTEDGFNKINDDHLHYNYSWRYSERPADEKEAKTLSESFLKTLYVNALLNLNGVEGFIPEYVNQAIIFTGDDIKGDNAMFTVFLYIVIAIIAFVFAVTTSNTINKESAVIGTLRASGYSKGELIRHYMAMPMLIVLIAAVIGNILGYTVFKGYMAALYYASYSLPTYVTIWNADAFVKTTVIPVILMFAINFIMLAEKMSLSPLRFLRRDLSRRQKKKAFRLKTTIPIMKRLWKYASFSAFYRIFQVLPKGYVHPPPQGSPTRNHQAAQLRFPPHGGGLHGVPPHVHVLHGCVPHVCVLHGCVPHARVLHVDALRGCGYIPAPSDQPALFPAVFPLQPVPPFPFPSFPALHAV